MRPLIAPLAGVVDDGAPAGGVLPFTVPDAAEGALQLVSPILGAHVEPGVAGPLAPKDP